MQPEPEGNALVGGCFAAALEFAAIVGWFIYCVLLG